ncbi:adenylosuccinate lyase family protein [Pelagicoccus sp. SDUM812002]|uniref:class-II fumarase/aspartase family protein n=1 Tax=Pelagicoccus sp. SDUM812002 TaxID=3041266 RepID=UPI00280EE770|nr:adenylosuccinate lyase family protein [Pelagicoccus sp. SDUM812002]MDQ8186280.1 adenylosuccinate lyase family protein [Pelagicoccus sp. SDUM812002]
MRSVFSDESRFRSWLETEIALSKAEASLGLIPTEAAENISQAARIDNLDVPSMKEHYERVGFPILPLVKQIASACEPESAKYVHWGATTQDIIDTGLVLQMKEALSLLEVDLNAIICALSSLAKVHRDTVMVGRTFQQHAAPVTFGYKAAVWLDEMLRHRQRLQQVRQRALTCSFGGAVGTLSTLGADGVRVLERLARELGLETPSITWHTARDSWAELIFWLSLTCSTLSKIATEVASLMRTEIDELREPFSPGRGGSSTMPQKRNPVCSPIIIAIGNRIKESTSSMLTAMIQDHERAVATQPLEWIVIPEAFVLASGSFMHSKRLLEGLQVNESSMMRNLTLGGGLLMSEAVMMGLAPKIGRGQAHELVYEAAGRANDEGISLRDALINDEAIMTHISVSELDQLLDPSNYLGSARDMIDSVLAKTK